MRGGSEPFQASKFFPDLTIHPVSTQETLILQCHPQAVARQHQLVPEFPRHFRLTRVPDSYLICPACACFGEVQVRRSHFSTPALFPQGHRVREQASKRKSLTGGLV